MILKKWNQSLEKFLSNIQHMKKFRMRLKILLAKYTVTDESVREIAILNRKKGERLTTDEIRSALNS